MDVTCELAVRARVVQPAAHEVDAGQRAVAVPVSNRAHELLGTEVANRVVAQDERVEALVGLEHLAHDGARLHAQAVATQVKNLCAYARACSIIASMYISGI